MKFRPLFALHKTVRVRFGYSAYKSVCKKCCRKYNISSLKDLEQVKSIRHRLEVNLQNGMLLPEKSYKSMLRKKS